MGQKINPTGLRMRQIRKWKSSWFLDLQHYTNFLLLNYEINKYILGVFRNNYRKPFILDCFIGKLSLDRLYIFIFFYRLRKKRKRISAKERRFRIYLFNNLEKILMNTANRDRELKRKKYINNNNNDIKFTYKNKLNLIRKNKLKLIHKELNSIYYKKNTKFKSLFTLNQLVHHYSYLPLNYKKKNNYIVLTSPKRFIKKKKVKVLSNENTLSIPDWSFGWYKDVQSIKEALSELTNSDIKLTLVNVLSFMEFYQTLKQFHKKNALELETKLMEAEQLERKLVNWFRYTVRFIQDVTHLTIITFFFKKPIFLAKFIGYQLYKTPRKFTHGKIMFFIIQLVKYVFTVREEITGLRIQFKGRINGRRRARKKQFVNFGSLYLPRYQKHIEYGCAHGITRYGTLGIKIWICYYSEFNFIVQKAMLLYFYYSKFMSNTKNFVVKDIKNSIKYNNVKKTWTNFINASQVNKDFISNLNKKKLLILYFLYLQKIKKKYNSNYLYTKINYFTLNLENNTKYNLKETSSAFGLVMLLQKKQQLRKLKLKALKSHDLFKDSIDKIDLDKVAFDSKTNKIDVIRTLLN